MKNILKTLFGACVCTIILGFVVQPASAIVIHESASLGPIGQNGGWLLGEDQFLGSRFTVTDQVQVTAIGGHIASGLGGAGTLFGAIVSMDGALPSGNPFDGTTLASTTFDPGFPSIDVLTPLSVLLNPGDYAVIFGGPGQFGATKQGSMASNNIDLPAGVGSYFFWNVNNWQNGEFSSARFVVEGDVVRVRNAVPEPITAALGLMGLGVLGMATRRRVA